MPTAAIEFIAVENDATRAAAGELITEYLTDIARLARENYGLEFDIGAMVQSDLDDRAKFYPPTARFYLLRHEGAYVGVGCLKQLGPGIGEIQRMYVRPHVRGVGAGRRLAERLIADARLLGYRTLRLESLKVLAPAHALYHSLGFADITAYADNSMEKYQAAEGMERYRQSVVFMELRLSPA